MHLIHAPSSSIFLPFFPFPLFSSSSPPIFLLCISLLFCPFFSSFVQFTDQSLLLTPLHNRFFFRVVHPFVFRPSVYTSTAPCFILQPPPTTLRYFRILFLSPKQILSYNLIYIILLLLILHAFLPPSVGSIICQMQPTTS